MELVRESVDTPLGKVLLVTSQEKLCSLEFEGFEERLNRLLTKRFGVYRFVTGMESTEMPSRVAAYFAGDLSAFSGVPLLMQGSPFQEKVWRALGAIAPGTTCSYKDIAISIHAPKASRAVGGANGLNPIALAVPCHRVIGASGTLGGYAGGLSKKRWLLSHERKWT